MENHNDRRLHVPHGIKVPQSLKDVVLADISLKTIETGWDTHLKVADAVMSGRLAALVMAYNRTPHATRKLVGHLRWRLRTKRKVLAAHVMRGRWMRDHLDLLDLRCGGL